MTTIRFPINCEVWRDDTTLRWCWVVRDAAGTALGVNRDCANKAAAQRQKNAFEDAVMMAASEDAKP